MAIDDNTLYGLTGAQIKELPGKIEAAKGQAKELTAADYNYPTDNPTSVALWLLDSGLYYNHDSSVNVKQYTTDSSTTTGFWVVDNRTLGGHIYSNILSLETNPKYTYFLDNGVNDPNYSGSFLMNLNLKQTTGTSTTDVMSQNAVTNMVYADPSTKEKVCIGLNADGGGRFNVVLGNQATAYGTSRSVAIGNTASAQYSGSIAIGTHSQATAAGEMNIGSTSTSYGYNNSNYRLLTGLYDGQSAHDAATKGQLDSIAIKNAGAPTTATTGTVGQLLEDTTNGKLYICTDATNPYVWEEVGAGGGGSGVTELTSADYNYPTANPDGVALWLLDSGYYEVKVNTTKVYVSTSESKNEVGCYLINKGADYINIIGEDNAGNLMTATTQTNGGQIVALSRVLSRDNITQSTGSSQGSVMSQNAVTSMVYADPANRTEVCIGNNATSATTHTVTLGDYSSTNYQGCVALGAYSGGYGTFTSRGIVAINSTNPDYGYGSNSQYRLLTGLYDPQSDHDAATKGYVDSQLVYAIGDTIVIDDDNQYVAGRQKVSGTTKTIECALPINKPLASDVTTVTFTPSGYNEAFGTQGLLFSFNNPTSSQLTFSCFTSNTGQAYIKVTITVVDSSTTLQHNNCCSVHLKGTFTLA